MAYLTGPDYKGYDEKQGFLSPRKDFPLSNYKSKLTQQIAQLGQQSSVFRFDGSDQMPGAVGSGSFWKGMVAWVSGQKDLDTVLNEIEESWPS
jgi:alpha-glucoside transport system substrate-binding protein